jgi:hypothetical protein
MVLNRIVIEDSNSYAVRQDEYRLTVMERPKWRQEINLFLASLALREAYSPYASGRRHGKPGFRGVLARLDTPFDSSRLPGGHG